MSDFSPRIKRNLERERAGRALARLADTELNACALQIQEALGYVAPATFSLLAERTGLSIDAVREAVEAAPDLREAPRGRHRVTVCTGRTCARRGGAELVRRARVRLAIDVFETTEDGAIRLEPFRCFGQCAMAPNILIDGSIRGAMKPERFDLLLDMLGRKPVE